jgi:hypothetical protein
MELDLIQVGIPSALITSRRKRVLFNNEQEQNESIAYMYSFLQ